eukprot:GFUD01024017.1.p1 GENE.GFUD01024017.1~~GFUD01024017.1.p1  ORF type:complete len:479 (-),score=99.08 GFUD01024017.1:82-1518(-)
MKRKSEAIIDDGLKRKEQMLARNKPLKKAELSDNDETIEYDFEDLITDTAVDDHESDEYIFEDFPTADDELPPQKDMKIALKQFSEKGILNHDIKEKNRESFTSQADENELRKYIFQIKERKVNKPHENEGLEANIKQEWIEINVKENFIDNNTTGKKNETLPRFARLRQKQKARKPDATKMIQCDECDYRTADRYNLSKHKSYVHQQVTNACKYCNKEFKHLKVHIDSVHGEENSFKCEQCEFVCNARRRLRCHIKRVHENCARQSCPFCVRKVKNLETHISKAHENPKLKLRLVKCEECPYKATSKDNLYNHTRTSHKIVTIICEICNAEINKVMKTTHMKKHMDNEFSCVVCTKTFRERRDLAGHILYAHKKQRTTCSYCDKEVTDLKQHVKYQHKDVDYKTIDISGEKKMISKIRIMLGQTYVYSGEFDKMLLDGDELKLNVANLSDMSKDFKEEENAIIEGKFEIDAHEGDIQ